MVQSIQVCFTGSSRTSKTVWPVTMNTLLSCRPSAPLQQLRSRPSLPRESAGALDGPLTKPVCACQPGVPGLPGPHSAECRCNLLCPTGLSPALSPVSTQILMLASRPGGQWSPEPLAEACPQWLWHPAAENNHKRSPSTRVQAQPLLTHPRPTLQTIPSCRSQPP